MRNIDCRNADLLLNPPDFRSHGNTQFRIEVGKRLIKKQHGGFNHQGPRQGNTLLLTAGQLVGHTCLHTGQLHKPENFHHPFPDFLLRHLA